MKEWPTDLVVSDTA